MTVRVSKFPSVQLDNSQLERQERAEQNEPTLLEYKRQECQENLLNILNAFAKDGNIEKYLSRIEKHKQKYSDQ